MIVTQTVYVTRTVTNFVVAPCYHPTVTTKQIDDCWSVQTKSANDIVNKHKGKVIAP